MANLSLLGCIFAFLLVSGGCLNVDGKRTNAGVATFQGKWAECPATCDDPEVKQISCYTYCINRGHTHGGECYNPGGPYELCCCNTD
ncbi:hypothetical protein Nepgr_032910 [Nepenthes gracilis]|uniref:Uncharacterized protein n=1 Tax=Nepenthes gracilis TaxID=150966 RepID=A0AAD3TLQ6_NEPGR|nr:hypothetical protein Nepgr_032910 [Nepenthes gracilis]